MGYISNTINNKNIHILKKVRSSTLCKDEERISALAKGTEELTQDAVQRDREKENVDEIGEQTEKVWQYLSQF